MAGRPGTAGSSWAAWGAVCPSWGDCPPTGGRSGALGGHPVPWRLRDLLRLGRGWPATWRRTRGGHLRLRPLRGAARGPGGSGRAPTCQPRRPRRGSPRPEARGQVGPRQDLQLLPVREALPRDLERHVLVPTGEKPFGKFFRHECCLKGHRLLHGTERPFPCHICGKGFITLSNLSRHLKLHRGMD